MVRGRLKAIIGDKAGERKKKKIEKEKQKRRSRKYGQAKLKHSKRGVSSCLYAMLTLFFFILIFSVSYISRGEVSILVGLVGLLAFGLSGVGFARGIQGLKERDKNYLTCKVGIGCNGVFLLGFFVIFLRGLF